MIAVLHPVPAPDPAPGSGAVFRTGLETARQHLQAGSARRLRAPVAAPDGTRPAHDPGTPAAELAPVPARSDDPTTSHRDLDVQRAGVRAALDELRRHRSHR